MTTRTTTAPVELSMTQIQQRLKPYRRSSPARAIWQLASTSIMLVGLAYLMWLSLSIGYWLTLLLAMPTAAMLVRLFIFQHDCGHGSFFKSNRANRIVGIILGIFTLTPYDDWRHSHALHHASHGDLDHRGDGDVSTLTVEEYQQKSWWGKLGYRLYRHPVVMFGVFPTLLFFVRFRIPLFTPRHLKRQRRSVWITNLGMLAVFVPLAWWIGPILFLMIYLPAVIGAATIGVWMFYVQHQFNPTYWVRHEQWDRVHAGLHGSSYYKLPWLLRWATGNIGLHHIHHLDSRIPNYHLQRCLNDHRELLDVPPLTVWQSLACARLKLWDEATGRMVGFRSLA